MGQGGRGQVSCYPGRARAGAGKERTRAEMSSSSATMVDAASPSRGDHEASTSGSAAGYIDHTVTRLDTLAGVAIKYGVEVADVKRFNGLTTDLQMFALKTLRIPTPGRHPPSASYCQSRCENFITPSARLHRDVKHKAAERSQDTSTMELLRDYYDLPTTSEGVEMATLSSDVDDEVLLPMFRPPNATDSRRWDVKPNRCGYVRESCNNLLESCWSVQSSQTLSESSLLLRSGKKVVREGSIRPIRRRTRGELGTDDVHNFPMGDHAPRPPYTTDGDGSSGIKSIGAAVEGLLFKVMQTASPEGGNPVPSAGSFSVLEGITSAYRHAKAALD